MRFCFRLLVVAVFCLPALGSELTIRVVDPRSAVVAGAQVELFADPSNRPIALQLTSAQGIA
ncbi:MAG: hypothetical protein DMG93_07895, partial [Acidobacteria bacterium]